MAADARSDPQTGCLSALSRCRPRPVLWRSNEWGVNFCLPKGSQSDVVESAKKPKPQAQPDVGSNAALDFQVGPARPRLSSLSSKSLERYYLRQEPGALVAHAGICAGGAEQLAFLPRL